MSVTEILAVLKNSSATAAQLRASANAADDAIKAGEAAVEVLEAKRQELLLEDGASEAIEKLEVEIRSGNREVERLSAAKAKLVLLIADAEARELESDLKAKGRRSAKVAKDLTEQMLRWDAAMATVGEAAAKIRELSGELGALRKHLHEHNRRDLVAVSPLARLADMGVQVTHPPDFDRHVPDAYRPPANSHIGRPLLRLMAEHQ